jgi:hypothetical protein
LVGMMFGSLKWVKIQQYYVLLIEQI